MNRLVNEPAIPALVIACMRPSDGDGPGALATDTLVSTICNNSIPTHDQEQQRQSVATLLFGTPALASHLHICQLGEFSENECRLMVSTQLQAPAVSPVVVQDLHAVTRGIPLFLNLVIDSLASHNALVVEKGVCEVRNLFLVH